VDNTLILHQEQNGIGYLRLLFDLGNIPEELLAYAGILKYVLGEIDTENYSYRRCLIRLVFILGALTLA